jgi:hypothetical protein
MLKVFLYYAKKKVVKLLDFGLLKFLLSKNIVKCFLQRFFYAAFKLT